MLRRDVEISGALRTTVPRLALALCLSHCGSVGEGSTGTSQQPILQGAVADAQDVPLLLLFGPEVQCSATLVAPNLVVTARHCVASTPVGGFSCTASGELIPTGTGYGSIGADLPLGSLKFYLAARVNAAPSKLGNPDALATQIISTGTPTACRDDVAFVVLDRAVQVTPLPVRLTSSAAGEVLSIWGFGLTDNINDLVALRVRDDAVVLGVGPNIASNQTQPAPVRALRTSPVTCAGDSGGAIVARVTNELIAIVSLGTTTAGTTGPFCSNNELNETVGPRLGAYPDLTAAALAAAQAALPTGPSRDASAEASTWDAGETDDSGISAGDSGAMLSDGPVLMDAVRAGEAAPSEHEAGTVLDASPALDATATPPPVDSDYVLGGGACAMITASRRSPASAWAAASLGAFLAARQRRARRKGS